MPGFVDVAPDGCSLRWPDYVGNNMFQTLVRHASRRFCSQKAVSFDRQRGAPAVNTGQKPPAAVDSAAVVLQGNLALNPRAGLLFIDFATGNTLQLTVRRL
jgi:hypothetical protein